MPVQTGELVRAIAVLVERRDIKVSVQKSAQGALIAGGATLVGGILLGPLGLALGGLFGGVTGMMTQGDFRSVSGILLNLSASERQRFVRHIENAVREFEITDLALLLPLLTKNASVQQAVIRTVIGFVTNELGMRIVD